VPLRSITRDRTLAPPPVDRPPRPIIGWQPEQFEFTITRDGQSLILPCRRVAASPWWVRPGIEGLSAPEVRLSMNRAAGHWGGLVDDIDVPPREVFLPLTVSAGSITRMLAELDGFDEITLPLRLQDPVRLTVRRPDGTTRWVDGVSSGPARPWAEQGFVAPMGKLTFGFQLTCEDPWFHGPTQTLAKWGQQNGPGSFFPLLPVRVSSDRILGVPVPVRSSGNLRTWPRLTVTGPATSITLTHVESGRSWRVVENVSPTATVVVSTDPRVAMTTGRQITNGSGTAQLWSRLQPPFDLWPLPPGDQTVRLEIAGATSATTARLEADPLYKAA
jgi:hypothetical protein